MTKFYINLLRLLAFVLAGLALIRPMMDLAALPSVISLPQDDYAAVQYANQSWAWLELIQLASFFSIVGLFFFEREHNRVIWPIRGAFIAQLSSSYYTSPLRFRSISLRLTGPFSRTATGHGSVYSGNMRTP
jgi:hypothetical protein